MLQVKNLQIGAGIPKICVPLAGSSVSQLLAEVDKAKKSAANLVEWRVDYFDFALDENKVITALGEIRQALGDMPLLVTFRTKSEGGTKEITREAYLSLNHKLLNSTTLDLLDIEILQGDDVCKELISSAQKKSVRTVLSSHNFEFTPSHDEMLSLLQKAVGLGCDIAKVAVMPKSQQDVLTLLHTSSKFKQENPSTPLIAISMGRLGVLSRIAGEIFGSDITFASLLEATAPGQLQADDLYNILRILHN